MPISLVNGAIGGAVQALSGANLFLTGAKTKKTSVGAKKTELIPGSNGKKPSVRRWSIYNAGQNAAFLFYGEEEEHGHPLPPGDILGSEDAGGLGNKVSALSPEGTVLRVTIRGNFSQQEEMPAPLKVKPFAPTGFNRPTKVTDGLSEKGLPLEDMTIVGQDQIDGLLDSDDDHTGFKFFELSSFELGQSYTFKIKLGEALARSYLSDYLQLPVKCWSLNRTKALELHLQVLYNQISPAKINITNQAWRIKQWIGVKLESLPGEFILQPDYANRFFGFGATDTRTGYENGLIWDFDPETNEFTILGF